MQKKAILPFLLFFLTFGTLPTAMSQGLTGQQIIEKAGNVYGGDDSVAKVSFVTKHDGTEDRMDVIRVWKLLKKDGINSKIMSFNTYPPVSVGVATLVFNYEFSENKQPDTWVYIPVIRKVKYLPPLKDKTKNRGEDDPNFASSLMKTRELAPRDPTLDTHKLLGQKTINGVDHYVIESIPKDKQFEKYSKVRSWIRKDNFLTTKVAYYADGKKVLVKRIQWKKVDDAWTWKKVVAQHRNGSKTTMTISDVKINTGLIDSDFNERTLKRGWR